MSLIVYQAGDTRRDMKTSALLGWFELSRKPVNVATNNVIRHIANIHAITDYLTSKVN